MAVLPFFGQDEKRDSSPHEEGVAMGLGVEDVDAVVDEDHDDLHREMKPRQLSELTFMCRSRDTVMLTRRRYGKSIPNAHTDSWLTEALKMAIAGAIGTGMESLTSAQRDWHQPPRTARNRIVNANGQASSLAPAAL